MSIHLRPKGEAAPIYGPDDEEFSVEFHHGGFFYGSGVDRAYLDGKVDWFDHIKVNEWSFHGLDEISVLLDYGLGLPVYWLLPEKDLSTGLRLIESETEAQIMKQVTFKVKNYVLYMDNYNSFDSNTWEDIVLTPISSLPVVISPRKESVPPRIDPSDGDDVGGPQVKPPVYEKRVGRPPKYRRKAAHEVGGPNGPRPSKHGVTIHCSHCREPGHNSATCARKKNGEPAVKKSKKTIPTPVEPDQPAAMKEVNQQENEIEPLMSTLENPIVSQLLDEALQPVRQCAVTRAISDSDYITSKLPLARHMPLTTASKIVRSCRVVAEKKKKACKSKKQDNSKEK